MTTPTTPTIEKIARILARSQAVSWKVEIKLPDGQVQLVEADTEGQVAQTLQTDFDTIDWSS